MVGRYKILRPLAKGGMAEIFLATVDGLEGFEKVVVIKRILPEFVERPEFVRMFLDEAKLAATLSHPNIAQVYDVGRDSGQYFFAMEHVHGQDLRTILGTLSKRRVLMPLGEALSVVIGACAGLHYAHEKRGPDGKSLGVIHRDVSPSNVLISYDGCPKIVDFGIAKAVTSSVETRTGSVRGKIAYLSPEQCRCETLDRRSDIFALGILLYESTTLTRLFGGGGSDFEIMRRIVDHDIQPPSARVQNYPPALERIVMKALSSKREDRYQSAQEMQLDLEAFAREERLVVSPVSLAQFMEGLFPDQILAWREAQNEGKALADHLVTRTETPSLSDPEISGAIQAAQNQDVIGTGVVGGPPPSGREADASGRPRGGSGESAASRAFFDSRIPTGVAESGVGERPATRRWLVVAGGLVVLIGGGGAWLGTRSLSQLPPPAVASVSPSVALQVVSTPAGATVLINGEAQTFVTPSTFQVPRAAAVKVRLELDGYVAREESVALLETESARVLRWTLESAAPKRGSLLIRSNLPHVTWQLDGKSVGDGSGALSLPELGAGVHQVIAEAKGFQARVERVELGSGQRLEFDWVLQPAAAPARVVTAPAVRPVKTVGAQATPSPTAPGPKPEQPGSQAGSRVQVFDKL
jgi:serine/threonine protein kinase